MQEYDKVAVVKSCLFSKSFRSYLFLARANARKLHRVVKITSKLNVIIAVITHAQGE